MDKNLFKLINLGVCAYYLIVYSSFQIYAKTFSLPSESGAALKIGTYGISLLTLLAGVFFFSRYRKGWTAGTDDNGTAASEAVELTGGSIILAIMLLKVIHGLCYYDYGALNLFFNPTGPLFSILFFMPFIVIATVTIIKGLMRKEQGPLPGVSAGLCFVATLLFVLYTCLYELLAWLAEMAAFPQYEARPQELYWICVQFVLIAAVLILIFAPLKLKNKFVNIDRSWGRKFTVQSLIIGSLILVINMSINILDFLISILVFLVSDFGGFAGNFSEVPKESFAVQLLPDLILLIIGLSAVHYGNKKGSQP